MARLPSPTVLALVAMSATGCAHWLPWQSDDWELSRTKRFTAYAPPGTDHLPTLTVLEQSAAVLQASLFKTPPAAPIEVLLLDWPEFRPTLGLQRTGVTIGELPGKGLYGKHGLVVMYGLDTTTAGAIHRLVHLMLYASAPRAPLWLHEGMASWTETAVFHEGEKDGVVCLGQLPQKQPDIPLTDLFAWSWGDLDEATGAPTAVDKKNDGKKSDAKGEDKKDEAKKGEDTKGEDKKDETKDEPPRTASAYRFTASNVIDYFMMGEGGKLRDKLPALIAALAEGAPTEVALAKVIPDLTPALLQDKTREHRAAAETTMRGLCPISYAVPAEPFAESAKPRVEAAPKEDIDRLFERLRMLPRRAGTVDWFPPSMIGVAGGQFPKTDEGKP